MLPERTRCRSSTSPAATRLAPGAPDQGKTRRRVLPAHRAQGSCSYANICEHCPNLRTDATFLPILAAQRADAATLAADAQARGWDQEAARHRPLIERIDMLMGRTAS